MSTIIIAQPTGNTGGNSNDKKNPNTGPYNNPYGNNPYGNNPYTDPSQSKDDYRKYQERYEQEQRDKRDRTTEDIDKEKNTTDKVDAKKQLNFQDLNNPENKLDPQILELYKNDPEYLKYLNASQNQNSDDPLVTKDEKDNAKQIFGAGFFDNNLFDLSDRGPSAPPLDYRLGPGDEIIVSMWGSAELQKTYTISKDGSIFPNLVGKIYLQGLNFDAASKVIESRFRKIIPSNTNIDVQLGKSRTIRVTVVGEVKRQGTYPISAYSTALNVLFRAGGVSDKGNLRKIEIRREGRTVEVLDLYKYLQKGEQAEEIYLEDNDYIFVDVYEKIIEAKGQFKRPMYYQMTSNEGLIDLVELAGGSASNARNSMIQLKTIRDEAEQYINISLRELDANGDDIILKDGDVVNLKPINEGVKNTVKVEGAVEYPDDYEVIKGNRISNIIEKAGGLQSTAYKPRAFVFRDNNMNESDAIKIDLLKLDELTSNIEVQAGDIVRILSTRDFENKYFIDVSGFVRKPTKVPYYKNMKLKDALLIAGGLTLEAEGGRIEISNVVDSVDKYNITSKGNKIILVSINSNLEIDEASENIVIKPLDKIFVRRKTQIISQDVVTIVGEVDYPGPYVLTSKNESLSSIIRRSGGIKKTAFAEGAKLYRKGMGQIVVDLPAALNKKNSNADIILKDSDIIIIPPANDIVSVKGEVQNQINVRFDNNNSSLKHYISLSGGYGERPWKNRINVRYQNGKIKSTKNYVFMRVYPKVAEGSTISVPMKPKREGAKATEVFGYSLSAVTSLATLLVLFRSL